MGHIDSKKQKKNISAAPLIIRLHCKERQVALKNNNRDSFNRYCNKIRIINKDITIHAPLRQWAPSVFFYHKQI